MDMTAPFTVRHSHPMANILSRQAMIERLGFGPVSASQTLAVWSSLAVITRLPSGEKTA
jgi:hypothetical protein